MSKKNRKLGEQQPVAGENGKLRESGDLWSQAKKAVNCYLDDETVLYYRMKCPENTEYTKPSKITAEWINRQIKKIKELESKYR